jgi:hypothetical protein
MASPSSKLSAQAFWKRLELRQTQNIELVPVLTGG